MTSSKSNPAARALTWGAAAVVVVSSAMVSFSHAHAAGTPPWTNVQTLSTTTTRSYDPVAIAVTPDGSKQIVLWESTDSGVRTIKSASATLTGGVALWGPTATVSTLSASDSRPNIALSWDGTRATAVWQDRSGDFEKVRSASATISGTTQTWGTISDVNTSVNGIAEVPKVALSPGGDLAVVTWYALLSGQYEIVARAAGITGTTQNWEGSEQVLTSSLSDWNTLRPVIAMNDNATRASVAYYATGSGVSSGQERIYSSSAIIDPSVSPLTATWGNPVAVSIPPSGQQANDVDLALSSGGEVAIATWTAYGSSSSVQTNIASISGITATWGAVVTLSDPGDSAGSSQVAISDGGSRATAVWSQRTGSNTYVVQARSATITGGTGTWDTTTDLSAVSGSANSPDVAVSSNGQLATAVWAYASGSNSVNVIQASNAFLNGATMSWSQRVDLSASSATPAADPSDPYGGFTPQLGLSSDGLVASTVWGWQSGTSFSVQTVKANGTCTQSWDGSTQCLPGAPTSASVTAGDASASLSWTAPADPYGYGITGYAYLLMDPSNNSVVRSWTSTGSTATSTTISGLTNGMTYVAYIAAINAFGQGSSAATSPLFTPSAAPAPGPGPQPSQTPTPPAQQIPATPAIPVASPSTPEVVAGVPDNPPVGQVVTPGLRLVSAEVADSAQPRLVKRDLGSTLKEAPVVDAVTRVPVSLVTQGLSSNTLYQVRVKVGRKTYVDLGGAVTDADGVAQLPVFQSARARTVTVALVDPLSGSTTYLKVKFTRGT